MKAIRIDSYGDASVLSLAADAPKPTAFDAVFDNVGGETYTNSFSVLKKGGVLLTMIAQPNGELAEKFGVRTLGQFTDVNTARLDRLSRLVADGAVKVLVDRVFPLSQVKEAFAAREGGRVRGKIVLQVRKEG